MPRFTNDHTFGNHARKETVLQKLVINCFIFILYFSLRVKQKTMNVPIIKSTATKAADRILPVVETMENPCNNYGINIRIYLQDSKPIFSSLYPK